MNPKAPFRPTSQTVVRRIPRPVLAIATIVGLVTFLVFKKKWFNSRFSRGTTSLLEFLLRLQGAWKHAALQLFTSNTTFVRNVKLDVSAPIYGTPFADLYKGNWNGKDIAAKRLRVFDKDERSRIRAELSEKAVVWREFNHPNILPFIGLDETTLSPFICLIAPWMENGNALQYLASHKNIRVISILTDVGAALSYLHNRAIVHGGLHASNVLIDEKGHALLADCGLAPFAIEVTSGMALSGNPAMRYLSPELHDPTRFGFERAERSFASDIYSFAMLAIELYTRKLPFASIRSDNSVAFAALEAQRPPRPMAVACLSDVPSDPVWSLLERCWHQDPGKRPTADQVATELRETAA